MTLLDRLFVLQEKLLARGDVDLSELVQIFIDGFETEAIRQEPAALAPQPDPQPAAEIAQAAEASRGLVKLEESERGGEG